MRRAPRRPATPSELSRAEELTKLIDATDNAEVFETAMTELQALSDATQLVPGYGLETLSRETILAVHDRFKCYHLQNELLCKGIITTKVVGNFPLCVLANPDTPASRLVELVLREFDAPSDATI